MKENTGSRKAFRRLAPAAILLFLSTGSLRADPAVLAANPDYYSVPENGMLNVVAATGLLHNDYSSNGVLTATAYSATTHGSVSVNISGSFTYAPTNGFTGQDSFIYFIGNGSISASNTCYITVYHPAPIAAPDVRATVIGQTVATTAANGVLDNDLSLLGTSIATAYAEPSHGTASMNISGSFTYQPDPGYEGTDSFVYYMSDGIVEASSTVMVVVAGVPPVVNNDYYAMRAGGTLATTAANGTLANDIPIMGDMTALSFSSASHGLVVMSNDGSFTYTADSGFVGTDTFTYYAGNGYLSTNATVTIEVVDNAPVAEPDYYHAIENGTLTVNAADGLLMNDYDPDHDSLVATSFSSPTHGMLVVSNDGSFVYKPDSNYLGSDTFTYYMSDGVLSSSATATITVFSGRGGVSINNDYYSVPENGTLDVGSTNGLLLNDRSGSGLTASSFSNPSHGSLVVSNDGSFVYTPDTGYEGPDSFTYYVTVGTVNYSATCYIEVYHPAPVATPDVYGVLINQTLAVPAGGVLDNDLSILGTSIATSYSSPSHGTASMNINGSFTYQPDAGYEGTDSFVYYMSDGVANASSTVTVSVVGVPPVVNNDYYVVRAGEFFSTSYSNGVLANDLPLMGTMVALSFSQASHGTVVMSNDGSFTYEANTGFVGTDSFTYNAGNGSLSASATVTIIVADDAPVAEPDYYHVAQNGTLVVAATNGLMLNDFDPDQDALTVTGYTSPAHGSLTIRYDGSFTYAPASGYVGGDSFTYYLTDGTFSPSTTASIQVTSVPGGQISHIGVTKTNVTLSCAGQPGATFDVQRTTNLLAPWLILSSTNVPPSGLFNYVDSHPPTPAAFYRLRQH